MARRAFDPFKAKGGQVESGPAPGGRREQSLFAHVGEAAHLTVSQAAELIKSTLEQRIPSPLRVIGQVSNLSAANHWYFSLKDESAVLGCVAWASTAKKFGFTPKDGDEVIATGHISHYPPQGRTQMYVSALKPVGAGALEVRFRAMCEELRKLGYFEEAHKKPLPAFPRRIAVITSATSAAVQDVINTAGQRCKAVGLLIVNVRVQGEGAAEEIARAIRWVDAHHQRLGIDAILVTRGGGSIEDLWAFNERIVADATYRCSIPIVAAIGHESDTTVIELVADVRAATPTQAAMRLVPAASELHRQINHIADRLSIVLRRRLDHQRQLLDRIAKLALFRDPGAIVVEAKRATLQIALSLQRVMRHRIVHERAALEHLAGRLSHCRPEDVAAVRRQRVAILQDRLTRSIHHHVRSHRVRIESIDRQLHLVGPHNVLKRGYSITEDQRGRLIRTITQVRSGQALLTRVADGAIHSIVSDSGVQRKRPGAPSRTGGQLDLFAGPDAKR